MKDYKKTKRFLRKISFFKQSFDLAIMACKNWIVTIVDYFGRQKNTNKYDRLTIDYK